MTADLRFTVAEDGAEPRAAGHLTGDGTDLVLDVDEPGAFAGSSDAPALGALAELLAARGLVVKVTSGGRHLVSLGDVVAPWWQRRATGSRRIRAGSLLGAWTAARSRSRRTRPVLPQAALAPPGTLFPLLPTFLRQRKKAVTTTHDPARGGSPCLVLVKESHWVGEQQPLWRLGTRTTIGSDPSCDIRLEGLERHHATVLHDDDDELVIQVVAGLTRVHGMPVGDGRALRTGCRVDVGEHSLVFRRDEFADHGRPYGGRSGGETGYQRSQPPRT